MGKRILILTAGSQGDIQPYVAVGIGLKQAGFNVVFATDSSFSSLVNSHALDFSPIRAPFAQLAQTEAGKAALAGKQALNLKQIMPMLRQMMDDAWETAQQFQPDVILYHPKTLAGDHIAEKLNISAFLAMPLPGYSPTSVFFNPIFGGGDRGGWLNRLSYTVFFKAALLPYRGMINVWRREKLNLPPYQTDSSLRGRAIPKLYGYSTYVLPIPKDWDASTFVTGYWFLNSAENWQPSPELQAFLREGTAPVYIGFGSMVTEDSNQTTALVLEAAKQSGQRAILATGWGGLSPSEVPHNVHMLQSAPHDWLFPRCTAVVHHGGAGTTGAGLRAGKPTVICPFIGDQFFWGKRVYNLGVGTCPIPQKRLRAEF